MRRLWLHAPSVLYMALIFGLSHQSQLPSVHSNDKFVHFVAYAVMAALFVRSLWFDTGWAPRTVWGLAGLAAALYGVCDEWHQSFVPGRDASVGDVAADALGALLGAGLALGLAWALARFTTRWPRATAQTWPQDAPSSSSP